MLSHRGSLAVDVVAGFDCSSRGVGGSSSAEPGPARPARAAAEALAVDGEFEVFDGDDDPADRRAVSEELWELG